jgi:hypothetical protein
MIERMEQDLREEAEWNNNPLSLLTEAQRLTIIKNGAVCRQLRGEDPFPSVTEFVKKLF